MSETPTTTTAPTATEQLVRLYEAALPRAMRFGAYRIPVEHAPDVLAAKGELLAYARALALVPGSLSPEQVLAQVAPDPFTREAADLAVALLRRGVVGADDPASVGSAPDPPVPS